MPLASAPEPPLLHGTDARRSPPMGDVDQSIPRSSAFPRGHAHAPIPDGRAGRAIVRVLPHLPEDAGPAGLRQDVPALRRSRSEEHTSELQSLMSISYDAFCFKKKNTTYTQEHST